MNDMNKLLKIEQDIINHEKLIEANKNILLPDVNYTKEDIYNVN